MYIKYLSVFSQPHLSAYFGCAEETYKLTFGDWKKGRPLILCFGNHELDWQLSKSRFRCGTIIGLFLQLKMYFLSVWRLRQILCNVIPCLDCNSSWQFPFANLTNSPCRAGSFCQKLHMIQTRSSVVVVTRNTNTHARANKKTWQH